MTSARRPPVQNFMQIRPWRASRQMVEIYAEIFIYDIPFFRNSPTGQTPGWILARDGSNDVVSARVCLLGVKKFGINIWPLKNPPKVEIWQKNWLRKFSAKTPLYKIFICKLPLIVIVAPKKLYSEQAIWPREFQICGHFWAPAYRSRDTGHAHWTFSPLTWANATLRLYISLTVQDRRMVTIDHL